MARLLPAALVASLTFFQQQASAQEAISVSTTVAIVVETVIPLTPGPAYNPGGPVQNATCAPDALSCPSCTGQNITDSTGAVYEVYCSSYISSSAVSQQPTIVSPEECMLACDGFFGCTGAYITDEGNCTLAIGALFGTEDLDGYTAFISMGDIIETIGNTTTSSVSGFPTSTGIPTTPGAPAPYANTTVPAPVMPRPPYATGGIPLNASWPTANATLYNATAPYPVPLNVTSAYGTATAPLAISTGPPHPIYPNTTSPSNTTMPSNSTCSIKHLTCPACDNQTITDLYNTTYTVMCDTSISSTSQYAFAEPLPAAYCMAECDERNATCVGAYWSDEECTLALGSYKATITNPGYVAFLRQAAGWPTFTSLPAPLPTTVPTWRNMSMYNTGPYGSAATGVLGSGISTAPSSASWTETITSTYSGFQPTATCNPQAISCPDCDGLIIVDGLNNTYRTQCNFDPSCDDTLGLYGTYSLNMCMERCDGDATCLAAIYNDHHCDLCQRGMDGTYDEDVDYLVLIPVGLGLPEVSTAVSLTATISSHTSILATTLSNASVTFAPVTAPLVTPISVHTAPGLESPLPSVRTTPISSFTASISIAPSSANTCLPSSPARAISCPDSDHDEYQATAGDFVVSCDHVLEAASQRSAVAVDLETCADQCLDDCSGVQWEDDTSDCLLLTSISVLAYSASWTAAVRVWQAHASSSVPALATAASISSDISATMASVSVPMPYTGPPPGLFPTFSFSPSTSAASATVTVSTMSLSPVAISAPTELSGFTTSTTVQAAVSTDVPIETGVPYNGPPRQHGVQPGGWQPGGSHWGGWFGRRWPW